MQFDFSVTRVDKNETDGRKKKTTKPKMLITKRTADNIININDMTNAYP